MTISYAKFFAPTVLSTAAGTLYTTPAQPTTTLLRGGRVRFTNTTASAASVTAYAVPSGGTPSASNAFLSGRSVPPNDYIDVDVPIIGPGDFISALSGTASAITAHAIAGGLFS